MMVVMMIMITVTTVSEEGCCDQSMETVKKEQAGLRLPGLRCAHFLGLSHCWGASVQGHRSDPGCWFPETHPDQPCPHSLMTSKKPVRTRSQGATVRAGELSVAEGALSNKGTSFSHASSLPATLSHPHSHTQHDTPCLWMFPLLGC